MGDRPGVAVGYLLASLGGGLALAALGLRLGGPGADDPSLEPGLGPGSTPGSSTHMVAS